MKTITASEANRQFSSVLREVSRGQVFTVQSRGKPVAAIMPIKAQGKERTVAKGMLLARLRQIEPTGTRTWTRNDLYDQSQ